MSGRYALLIGNSTFRHRELARLAAPANDVRALSAALEDRTIGSFKTELKLDIVVEDAKAAMRRLFMQRHPDDLVLLYYSGHGLRDTGGRFYLAMTPTDPADPDPASIDEDWLRRVMNECAAKCQVVILDCCHSAALIPGHATPKDAQAGPVLTQSTFAPRGHGRFIMAATTADASAYEQSGSSLYTRHLVEGLTTGAAAPQAEEISVFDLHRYVAGKVAGEVQDLMRPQLWRDADLNPTSTPLVLARNPRPRVALDPELLAQLASHQPQDVELAFYRLRDIAESPNEPRAALARDALRARLADGDTLPFSLGEKMSRFVRARPQAAAGATEAESGGSGQLPGKAPPPPPEPPPMPWWWRLAIGLALGGVALGGFVVWMLAGTVPPVTSVYPAAVGQTFQDCPHCPEMMVIPAGRFMMGSSGEDEQGHQSERPVREVSVPAPLAIGRYHVTVAEYRAFVEATLRPDPGSCRGIGSDGIWAEQAGRNWRNPGFRQEDTHPVVCVNWQDAQDYAQWLTRRAGLRAARYRLPTEAEWEYAARARPLPGSTYRFWWGNDAADQCRYANGADRSARASVPGASGWTVASCDDRFPFTSPVGAFQANGFGLFDMAGNAWQWVEDAWHANHVGASSDATVARLGDRDTARVLRGGSWNDNPQNLRSANRNRNRPDDRGIDIGFRVARTPGD